jgi:eukaryotic-like serine/threonine-protein kinase
MELTVQNVYGLLLRSKLLSIDDCKTMFTRWQEEAKAGSTNVAKFAAWMVANRYVTEYQATLLARGHAEGFFINEYKILDRLGKGRMAGVYKAQHGLGQVVAVKVLPPSRAKEPTMLARFLREAQLAMKLKHANIVRTFQVGSHAGLNYLVMELLDGETLEDVLLRRKKVPFHEAVRLIYQALHGLQHIHEQGLVHRDLKPANLMLVPPPMETTIDCTIKILDLGLGRVLNEDGFDAQDPGLTGEGVLLGTPDYMAPEQARDPRATDIRADIYSLGCVLYHLLAGQPPFPDTNIISQMIRHATEPIRPVKEFEPSVPDGLQQILEWMMAKDPAGRYPTPQRAAGSLEMFLAAGAAPASSPDLDPEMQPYLRWLEVKEKAPQAPPAPMKIPRPPQGAGLPETTPMVMLSGGQPGGAKPASAILPAAPPVPAPAMPPAPERKARPAPALPPLTERPASRGKGSSREARRKKKKTPSSPPPPPRIDVELVAVLPESAPRPMIPPLNDLNRRDFFMFFVGIGSGLLAYGLGHFFASLFQRRE